MALLSLDGHNAAGLLGTAVALLHQSTKRTCSTPSHLQLRAFALLLRYYEDAARSPEAAFNVARACHMLGITDLAVVLYRRALGGRLAPSAAFNMHLIMVQSGQMQLAAHLLAAHVPAV